MNMETKRPVQIPPGVPIDPAEGYEHRDADTGTLLKYGLGLVLVLAAVLLSMKWMFGYFAKSQPLGPPASPFENARVLPPEPRLQAKPRADLRDYCGEQMQKLDADGWVDSDNGIVRIPIDRAMDLTVQRGLPARPANGDQSNPSTTGDMLGTQSSPNGPCAYWIGEDEYEKAHNPEVR
jgi:hypothetical protein